MLAKFRIYIFAHYKVIEWVFTLRLLLIAGLLLSTGHAINRVIGGICLSIGLAGLVISQHWVRNLANVWFAVSIFSLSVGLESIYIVRRDFDEIIFYTLLTDILISAWLLKRVMLEYHERSSFHRHHS